MSSMDEMLAKARAQALHAQWSEEYEGTLIGRKTYDNHTLYFIKHGETIEQVHTPLHLPPECDNQPVHILKSGGKVLSIDYAFFGTTSIHEVIGSLNKN